MPTIRENFQTALTAAISASDIDERFRLTDKAWTANNPVGIDLEETGVNKRILLRIYEGLAKAGHLGAMRACACIYFSGEANQEYTETQRPAAPDADTTCIKPPIDILIISHPDYKKALQWCEKAAESGSEWAKGALPQMKQIVAAAGPKAVP